MERAAMRYSLASTTSMRKSASSASVDALTVQEEEEGGSQRETTPNVSLKGGACSDLLQSFWRLASQLFDCRILKAACISIR